MKVLVCGGRDFTDREFLFAVLDQFHQTEGIALLIHGAARGADSLARDWARARGVWIRSCPADWRTHGLAAGPIRNQQMLELLPDVVIAFEGGKGTADMVRRARKAGVRCLLPRPE